MAQRLPSKNEEIVLADDKRNMYLTRDTKKKNNFWIKKTDTYGKV